MNAVKFAWFAAPMLVAVVLTGCGGGGGSPSTPSAPTSQTAQTPPPPDPQRWAPYFQVSYTNGVITRIDHLSVASTTQVPTTASVGSGSLDLMSNAKLDPLNYTFYDNSAQLSQDSSGMLRYTGRRYFFFLSAGVLYRLDLTSVTPPAPVAMASLGLTQLCSIHVEQADALGKQGDVVITGFDSTGSSATECSSTPPNTWVVPMTASGTAAAASLGFYVNPLFAFSSGTTSTGYLTQSETGALYVTNDLKQRGTPVHDSQGTPLTVGTFNSDVQVVDSAGDGHHAFIILTDYLTTASSTIYAISATGEAVVIHAFNHPYQGVLGRSDAQGDLFVVDAQPPATGSDGLVSIFRAPPSGGAATQMGQFTVPGATSAFAVKSYLPSSDGQRLLVTLTTNFNPLTQRTYVFDAASGQATALSALDDTAPYFYPFGNVQTQAFSNPNVPGISVFDLGSSSVKSTLGGYVYGGGSAGDTYTTAGAHMMYVRDMVVGRDVSQPYLMTQSTTPPVIQNCGVMSSPIDFLDMTTGQVRASFTPPNNSCVMVGASITNSSIDFVTGKTYDATSKLGRLFVVAPGTNAPTVTTIETDTPSSTTNGQASESQWAFGS